MANPVLPDITDAAGAALSDAVDAGTGIRHMKTGLKKTDTPTIFTRQMQLQKHLFTHLGRYGGACVALSGLNVGVFAVSYMIGATEKSFAGVATQALTPSVTSYLYLDNDQTLKISTSAWPAGDHFKIAKVTTSATAVTALVDARQMNHLIGIANAWSTVQASSEVDFNGNGIKGVKNLAFSDETTLTIAAGSITPTQTLHLVDTEGAAGSDDLDTISFSPADRKRLLLLRAADGGRTVTIKDLTGNIQLEEGDAVLDNTEKCVLLYSDTVGTWLEIARNFHKTSPLTANLDASAKNVSNVGLLGLKVPAGVLSVVSGAITVTQSLHFVAVGSGTPPDELDTINGGADGDLLVLIGGGPSTTVTLKNGGNLILARNTFFEMSNGDDVIVLINVGSTLWVEVSRSWWLLSELTGTGQVIPYAIGPCHYPGTLSDNQATWEFLTPFSFKLVKARGRVVTAPSGGSCVIDVLKNGASVYAAPANAINILDGTNDDASDGIDVDFIVGDRVTVKVITASTAASATVSFEAYTQAIAPAP